MSSSNVPSLVYGPTGWIAPPAQAVLNGVLADWNAAFGGGMNLSLTTSQGQACTSIAASISNANSNFVYYSNQVDPAYAQGRMQDGIGRIYFLERIPDASTVVQAICIGAVGVVIPAGAQAVTDDGNIYGAVSGGVIPAGGSLTLSFACLATGPIPCPAGSLTTIYRAIPGWDTINNPSDGALGNNVESRQAFETRRQASVAGNAAGSAGAVRGAILGNNPVTGLPNCPGVLDAYVQTNDNGYPLAVGPVCVITGSISGTTLTVATIVSGTVVAGQTVTGSDGSGIGVATGTTIVSGSGTSWVVNNSQTVASTTMNLGGVILNKRSLYVAVVGGASSDIAQAIITKKSPGCGYNGNTTVTAYDPNTGAAYPGTPYTVSFEIPPPLPFCVKVTLVNNPGIPSNALGLIQTAVVAAFAGSDAYGPRATIGSLVLASRFYPGIAALGNWAQISSILLGTSNAPAAVITGTIGATLTATGSGANLTVSAITGYLSVGDVLSGAGVPNGTTIVSQSSGTTGSTGVYVTSSATTSSSAALSTVSMVLHATAVASGALAVGQFLFGANMLDGTQITALGTGSGSTGTYALGNQQFVVSETMDAVTATLSQVQTAINQDPTVTDAEITLSLV